MTAEQLMESQKFFAASNNTITCCCCGGTTIEAAGVCNHCRIPLVVSQSSEDRGIRPGIIPVLGGSGAGKTVYIGMLLDILSKRSHSITGQPNNAFSVAVQQRTVASLERRRFPEKTVCESEEWDWIHCAVRSQDGKTKPLDLVAPDLAGEAMLMEFDHPNSFPVVHSCVSQACAAILLVDAVKARDHGTDEDLLATKVGTYIYCNARRIGLVRKNVGIPLAIAFTKTDSCVEAADDPKKFAKNNLPGFYAYAERNLKKHKFFSTSVVGSVTKVSDEYGDYALPLHVQPKGIIDPLEWILKSQ